MGTRRQHTGPPTGRRIPSIVIEFFELFGMQQFLLELRPSSVYISCCFERVQKKNKNQSNSIKNKRVSTRWAGQRLIVNSIIVLSQNSTNTKTPSKNEANKPKDTSHVAELRSVQRIVEGLRPIVRTPQAGNSKKTQSHSSANSTYSTATSSIPSTAYSSTEHDDTPSVTSGKRTGANIQSRLSSSRTSTSTTVVDSQQIASCYDSDASTDNSLPTKNKRSKRNLNSGSDKKQLIIDSSSSCSL